MNTKTDAFSLDQNFVNEKMKKIINHTSHSISRTNMQKMEFKKDADLYKNINNVITEYHKIMAALNKRIEQDSYNIMQAADIMLSYDKMLSNKISGDTL